MNFYSKKKFDKLIRNVVVIFIGSPYKFHVDSIASGFVTAYGPGLTHGVTGEPCNFTISTKGAGAGGLSLAVEGPSKAEVIFLLSSSFVCNDCTIV